MYGEPQERFDEMLKAMGDIQLARPAGCDKCGTTGYRGRTGIHELLVATPDVKKLIVQNASVSELRELAIREGMTTLMQDGIWKVLCGQSDIAQLRKVVTVWAVTGYIDHLSDFAAWGASIRVKRHERRGASLLSTPPKFSAGMYHETGMFMT